MRRDEKGGGGFLLGAAIGIAAGVAGGLALLRQGRAADTMVEFREEIVADGQGDVLVDARAEIEQPRSSDGPAERVRSLLSTIQLRWGEAIAEGRSAAADRKRELQSQLAAETKRLPEFEVELLEAAREHSPEAVREFERLTSPER